MFMWSFDLTSTWIPVILRAHIVHANAISEVHEIKSPCSAIVLWVNHPTPGKIESSTVLCKDFGNEYELSWTV